MVRGLFAWTTPLILLFLNFPMKLSELQALCNNIAAKYGDIDIAFHEKDEAYDVTEKSDCRWEEVKARYFKGGDLPGAAIDESEEEPNADECVVFFLF